MASSKFIALLAVAMAVAVIVSGVSSEEEDVSADAAPMQMLAKAKSNDLILGKRTKGDKLVEKQVVKKSAKPLRVVTETRKFNAPRGEITQVKALNRASKNAAVATVVSGGVGHDYVELKFKSKRSHGISFEVTVYAKDAEESTESEEDDSDTK